MTYRVVDLKNLLDVESDADPVKGRMLVGNGTSWEVLEPGAKDQVLTVVSITDDIAWANPSASGGGGGGGGATNIVDIDGPIFDHVAGSVVFRWGIDQYGRPYSDSTGGVVATEAARIYLDLDDDRFYAQEVTL